MGNRDEVGDGKSGFGKDRRNQRVADIAKLGAAALKSQN
jgi:hypothetical protein